MHTAENQVAFNAGFFCKMLFFKVVYILHFVRAWVGWTGPMGFPQGSVHYISKIVLSTKRTLVNFTPKLLIAPIKVQAKSVILTNDMA